MTRIGRLLDGRRSELGGRLAQLAQASQLAQVDIATGKDVGYSRREAAHVDVIRVVGGRGRSG